MARQRSVPALRREWRGSKSRLQLSSGSLRAAYPIVDKLEWRAAAAINSGLMHHKIRRASVAMIYSITSLARGSFELQVPAIRRVSDDRRHPLRISNGRSFSV